VHRSRRSIRNCLVRAVLFLLLGAFINLIVASILASSAKPFVFDRDVVIIDDPAIWWVKIVRRPGGGGAAASARLLHIKEHDDDRIVVENPDGDDRAAVYVERDGEMIVWLGEGRFGTTRDVRSFRAPRVYEAWLNPSRSELHERSLHFFDRAFGWPMLSMCWMDGPDDTVIGRFEYCYDRPVSRPPMDRCLVVPLIPLPLGLAVNSLVYAAILWPLWILIMICWRWWIGDSRIKRGLCPSCKYPIGTSSVCTECGRNLPKRAGATS
jgi:hypothetical protein